MDSAESFGALLVQCTAPLRARVLPYIQASVIFIAWLLMSSSELGVPLQCIPPLIVMGAILAVVTRLVTARQATDVSAYEYGLLFHYNDEKVYLLWEGIRGTANNTLFYLITVKHIPASYRYPLRWALHNGIIIPRWRKNSKKLVEVVTSHLK